MSIAHLLENFDAVEQAPVPAISEVELENLKLEAFETGYKAGWDDAVKARSEETDRITEDFARNLSDLSFTYHEAHAEMMNSMGLLLHDIVEKVLPRAVQETIGMHVVEQLTAMAQENGSQRVEIVTSAQDLDAVRGMMTGNFGFPVDAVSDETLAPGQVFLRMAQDERQIDLDAVLSGIRDAVAGLLDESERTLKHG